MRRVVIAQFFQSAFGAPKIHSIVTIADVIGHQGSPYTERRGYDVEWSRHFDCYLYHHSGCGGGAEVVMSGLYHVSGNAGMARIKEKPAEWVHSRDKPPWRSKQTRLIRKRNRTHRLLSLPKHIRTEGGGDLLDWLARNGIEQDAVHCSECQDWLPGNELCRHCWWCDKTGWYSTPWERCECKDREECDEGGEQMKPEKVAAKYVTPIDPMELAVRLAESFNQMKRPPGATAAEALFSMEKESADAYLRAANAVLEYWRECIDDIQQTN